VRPKGWGRFGNKAASVFFFLRQRNKVDYERNTLQNLNKGENVMMIESIFGIAIFVLGAIFGCALVTMYEMHRDEERSKSEEDFRWSQVIDSNRELLERSFRV